MGFTWMADGRLPYRFSPSLLASGRLPRRGPPRPVQTLTMGARARSYNHSKQIRKVVGDVYGIRAWSEDDEERNAQLVPRATRTAVYCS